MGDDRGEPLSRLEQWTCLWEPRLQSPFYRFQLILWRARPQMNSSLLSWTSFCRMEPRGWDYRGTVKGMTVEETLGPAWTSCFFEACPRYLISQAINISLSLVMHVWGIGFVLAWDLASLAIMEPLKLLGSRPRREGGTAILGTCSALLLKYGGHACPEKTKVEYTTHRL